MQVFASLSIRCRLVRTRLSHSLGLAAFSIRPFHPHAGFFSLRSVQRENPMPWTTRLALGVRCGERDASGSHFLEMRVACRNCGAFPGLENTRLVLRRCLALTEPACVRTEIFRAFVGQLAGRARDTDVRLMTA
jgi:hypothetical protein